MTFGERLRRWWAPETRAVDPGELERRLAELREKTPTPVFWMLGKTQSGKSSVVQFLTGAEAAIVGNGFRPCTRTSQEFPFPDEVQPLLTFLDTRGVDEPTYDPSDDLAAFDRRANLVLVTVRLTDFATGNLRTALVKIRAANPTRPVVLAVTCLHEARPQEQHPQPYPFPNVAPIPAEWERPLAEQRRLFEGLHDSLVPIDLTKPVEGYTDPTYGGEALKRALLAKLPAAYQTTFQQVQELQTLLRDHHIDKSRPRILQAVALASSSAIAPIPGVGMLLLPEIQKQMLDDLAIAAEAPEAVEPFLQGLGGSLRRKQAWRELVKFIPGIGTPASAALSARATYALGVAFCEYLLARKHGQRLSESEVRGLYEDQLTRAATAWGQP
ncbi:MAG: GTPase family protein [Fimbriiglobus sp.]